MSGAGNVVEEDKAPDQGGAHINLKVKGQSGSSRISGAGNVTEEDKTPDQGGAHINYKVKGQGEHESEESMQNTADMTAFVQNLLVQMQTRFQTMSENIIDEMGGRIDELEESINDLKAEMCVETPVKMPEETKSSDCTS